MNIVLKKYDGKYELLDNEWSLDYFKIKMNEELTKISYLNEIIDGNLSDEDYLKKMLYVYEVSFNDFANVPRKNILYTQVPKLIEEEGKPTWYYRAYQVANDIKNLTFIGEINEGTLEDLVNNGLILVDEFPYERTHYEYTFIFRDRYVEKIPVLSKMDKNDSRYNDWLLEALKNVPKIRLTSDRNKLKDVLRKDLETIKIYKQKGIDMNNEIIKMQSEIVNYCDDVINKIK